MSMWLAVILPIPRLSHESGGSSLLYFWRSKLLCLRGPPGPQSVFPTRPSYTYKPWLKKSQKKKKRVVLVEQEWLLLSAVCHTGSMWVVRKHTPTLCSSQRQASARVRKSLSPGWSSLFQAAKMIPHQRCHHLSILVPQVQPLSAPGPHRSYLSQQTL